MAEQLGGTTQMGRCSVTGKMVPEDELVTIAGQRVCAEGKAILLQRLKAGEAAPGEMEKPGVIRRVGCIILDGIILGIPGWIMLFMVAGERNAVSMQLVTLLMAVVGIIYFAELHFRGGQSIGKMAGKIMVVNLDGSAISRNTAYIRALGYAGPNLIAAIVTFFAVVILGTGPRPAGAAGGAWFLLMLVTVLVGIYGVINALMALFDNSGQRALHDRIAGTRVVLK